MARPGGSNGAPVRWAKSRIVRSSALGRAIGVVQKYENGVNRIGAGRLARIAAAPDVPVAVLFGSGRRQRHVPSPPDELAIEGADRAPHTAFRQSRAELSTQKRS